MPETQSWEFLIQQDGDRDWQPLVKRNVELLEGRYRIAAKSSRKNAPVEVRIKHDAINETPPKRRTQTRINQTNRSGLMAVIPFTRLQPGIWEFRCAPQEGSPHSIQLRVLSIESDIVEDWNPDWESADQATFEFAAPVSIEEILHQAEQESSTIADEILFDYGLVPEEPYQDYNLQNAPISETSTLSIELTQDTYIVHKGEPLTISGQITSDRMMHLDAELRVCLRDPQTSKTLLDSHEILHQEALPFELVYRVTLPVELETQLILGEITLHDATVEGKPIVATQSFSLMADVDELLNAIQQVKKDDRTMAEDMLDLPTENPVVHPPLNLAFLNLVAAAKDPEAVNFTPKETQALPPQLHQPDPHNRKKLALPNFGVQPDGAIPEYTPPDTTQLEIPLTGASAPSEVQPEIQVEAPEEPSSEQEIDRPTPLEEPEPRSGLKIQADDRDEFHSNEPALDLQPTLEQAIDEFVIDDEPILPLVDLILSRRRNPGQADRAQNPLLLPETEPVPAPVVTIAESELIRGKNAVVRIKLPDILPKIYVKLWVNDRQNRTMIEPSRWVIDFKPDGHGKLEATTALKVPFESVEIQIEAISVEVMTNRESHKVTVDRRVIPEELPDLWLDNFDDDSVVSS
ncbi:MAG: hypothetical protein C4288_04660 [Leptolyngbya sp. ERB_1_1]